MLNKILFWQPKENIYQKLCASSLGKFLLVSSNYLTWIYFFIVSAILISKDKNIFFVILLATILSELIEKYLKTKNFWPRPSFKNQDISSVPKGLVKSWYTNGSFPSGHTTKATFFFLFIFFLAPHLLPSFFVIILPLLFFRVLTGFHYPIDLLGGVIFGYLIWLASHELVFSVILVDNFTKIFNFFFFFL